MFKGLAEYSTIQLSTTTINYRLQIHFLRIYEISTFFFFYLDQLPLPFVPPSIKLPLTLFNPSRHLLNYFMAHLAW